MKKLLEVRPQRGFPSVRRTKTLSGFDYDMVLGCLTEKELAEELRYLEDLLEEDISSNRFQELTSQKDRVITELFRRT